MDSGGDSPHFDTTVLRLGVAFVWFRMKAFICGICMIAVVSALAGCAMTARVDDTSFTFTFKRFVDEKDL
jgi:hypothetical protein